LALPISVRSSDAVRSQTNRLPVPCGTCPSLQLKPSRLQPVALPEEYGLKFPGVSSAAQSFLPIEQHPIHRFFPRILQSRTIFCQDFLGQFLIHFMELFLFALLLFPLFNV